MRAIDELRNGDNKTQIFLALTGNGPKERKVLRAMAERYPQPNEKLLWIPEAPSIFGRGNRKIGRHPGFSVLRVIKTYVGLYKICNYLVMIDYEYVNRNEELAGQIEGKMKENGFNPIDIQQLTNQAFLVRCKDSAHEFSIRIVISGRNRRIEENEAALINLHYDRNIEPEKNVIALFYRQNNMNLSKLIRNASRRNLSTAFADLIAALDNIENSN